MTATQEQPARLSRKEWYVALLDAHGASRNETASSLGMGPTAVDRMLHTARGKLGARTRSDIRRVIAA